MNMDLDTQEDYHQVLMERTARLSTDLLMAMNYEDFTVHKDEIRKKKYWSRMGRFQNAYKYSPGYLSLVLLW